MPYKDPEKQREYQRQWMADRRAEWFSGKSCVDCGSTEALELDHVDPTIKIDHKVWSWSLERREAELAKCEARCHEHHTAKTYNQRSDRASHGSPSMYQNHRCRCAECRKWKRESDQKYKSRRVNPTGLGAAC